MQAAINMAKGGGSSILSSLASRNPQMSAAMTILQAMNGNLEQAVRTMAQQQGRDVNQMISEFQQCMGQN